MLPGSHLRRVRLIISPLRRSIWTQGKRRPRSRLSDCGDRAGARLLPGSIGSPAAELRRPAHAATVARCRAASSRSSLFAFRKSSSTWYCAPSATRTRDLLLRRHFRDVPWHRYMGPDVGFRAATIAGRASVPAVVGSQFGSQPSRVPPPLPPLTWRRPASPITRLLRHISRRGLDASKVSRLEVSQAHIGCRRRCIRPLAEYNEVRDEPDRLEQARGLHP